MIVMGDVRMVIQSNKKCAVSMMLAALFSVSMTLFVPAIANDKVVNILNWEGQIGPTTVERFTKETGIRVVYDTFDSNEVLEGKLLVGRSGFDVVSPSDSFLARQIVSNLYYPLDKSKLPNLKNMDPQLMSLMAQHDPNNKYAIPYVWMTTGIGYNVKKIKEVLGEDFVVDSWQVLFKPEYMEKLSRCGVAFLDAPIEIFASALRYLGLDPNSTRIKDYSGEAYGLLSKVRPYIRYFHSSQYISDLATGDICIVLGWSGDIIQARNRAQESGNGVQIQYALPKEGGLLFFDTFAIPADSKHVDEAHAFLNFIMRPDIAAEVTNARYFANANKEAKALVLPKILHDSAVYPSDEAISKTFIIKPQSPNIERIITRTWTRLRTGK